MLVEGFMPTVKVITTMEFQTDTSEQAWQLGRELENRLNSAIEALMPNLRYVSVIKEGDLRFDMSITGRRVRIRPNKVAAGSRK